MAAPTNSGESDMATEELYSDLSPLLSPRWSQLCCTPSPPWSFLPSSSSMVMQYQGSNQSMDDPRQNQEHDNNVDPAPYLAGDSALLQQQLRKNWSEASDWRPRGVGIMTMNNQGFEEWNMGFEESMEMTTCFYFPPSPTNFPLYRPMPSVFFVSSKQENISSALSCQHILEDKSGALHVLNGVELRDIFDLLFVGVLSYLDNIADVDDLVPDDLNPLMDVSKDEILATIRRINWLEQHDEDIVDQQVIEQVGVAQQLIQNREQVGVAQQLIQNRGGELDVILGGGVLTVNGLERRDGQSSPTTPETLLICPAKFFLRVWLGHGGQWVAEIRCRLNHLNIGSFTTVEDAMSAYELVIRWSGRADLTAFPRVFGNENKLKLLLQLPPPAQELNLAEDFGLVCCNATGNDEIEAVETGSERTGDCVMADQARLNSRCLGKRKIKENNPWEQRRNKKANGVRIAIPSEDILQIKGMRLKDAANHLEVGRSTLEHNLISCPNETPVVVDQEGIPQLNYDSLPSDQPLAATVGKNSVVVKEIPQPQFSLIDQQDNPDDDFGKDEVEAVGMVGEGTGEGKMEEGQLNSGCLGKGKRKKETSGGDRRNKKTNGVKIAISLDDILQAEGMLLEDAAKKFKVSQSTLKRVCRKHGILSWPPSKGNDHICQSRPEETPAVVDQEGVQQLECEILPSDQALAANVDTNSVVLKARWVDDIIVKIRLPKPWKMAKLEEQVKKRLKLEFGTYYIRYKDEENELITILCDEDLEEYISNSSLLDTSSIEIFLVPK